MGSVLLSTETEVPLLPYSTSKPCSTTSNTKYHHKCTNFRVNFESLTSNNEVPDQHCKLLTIRPAIFFFVVG